MPLTFSLLFCLIRFDFEDILKVIELADQTTGQIPTKLRQVEIEVRRVSANLVQKIGHQLKFSRQNYLLLYLAAHLFPCIIFIGLAVRVCHSLWQIMLLEVCILVPAFCDVKEASLLLCLATRATH